MSGIYLTREEALERTLVRVVLFENVKYLVSEARPQGGNIITEAFRILDETPKGYGLAEISERRLKELNKKYGKEGNYSFLVGSNGKKGNAIYKGRVEKKDLPE